jgi:hypothetical protein
MKNSSSGRFVHQIIYSKKKIEIIDVVVLYCDKEAKDMEISVLFRRRKF